jgi:hypothetical protein
MFSPENIFPMSHELRDGVDSISDALLELGSNERDGLCLVETQTAGEPALSYESRLEKVYWVNGAYRRFHILERAAIARDLLERDACYDSTSRLSYFKL